MGTQERKSEFSPSEKRETIAERMMKENPLAVALRGGKEYLKRILGETGLHEKRRDLPKTSWESEDYTITFGQECDKKGDLASQMNADELEALPGVEIKMKDAKEGYPYFVDFYAFVRRKEPIKNEKGGIIRTLERPVRPDEVERALELVREVEKEEEEK